MVEQGPITMDPVETLSRLAAAEERIRGLERQVEREREASLHAMASVGNDIREIGKALAMLEDFVRGRTGTNGLNSRVNEAIVRLDRVEDWTIQHRKDCDELEKHESRSHREDTRWLRRTVWVFGLGLFFSAGGLIWRVWGG